MYYADQVGLKHRRRPAVVLRQGRPTIPSLEPAPLFEAARGGRQDLRVIDVGGVEKRLDGPSFSPFVIPGMRLLAQAPESIKPGAWLWVPGSFASSAAPE